MMFKDEGLNNDHKGMNFDEGCKQQYIENYMRPSNCYKNVFNEDERKELTEYMFRKTKYWRTSSTGNLFFNGNFRELTSEIVYPKLKDLIPKDEIDWDLVETVAGNFFHTPHQYGVHTDMPEVSNTFDSNSIVYRSLLIPMYLLGPEDCKIHMIYYDQRVVDNGCTLDYGPYSSTTHYRSFVDYTEIDNVHTLEGPSTIDPTKDMPEEEYIKAGLDKAPSPIERYHGLSVENSYEWVPGDVHTFDTAQVHSSTLGKPKFKTKAGLRISLITKRDYVNYK